MSDMEKFLQQMNDQFQGLQNTIAQQNATLASQHQQIQSLTDEIHAIKNKKPAPEVSVSPPPNQQKDDITDKFGLLSEKLPDPPVFTGRKKELTPFITQLRYKLEANGDRYPTARAKFLYAQSRISGDAAIILDPLYDKDVRTVQDLITFLEASYGDPNRKATALARLGTLKQGRRSFVSHFTEFRRIAADSELNETGLIMQLKASLNSELQRAMIGTVPPDTLNEYANQIARYDNDLQYIRTRHSAPRVPAAPALDDRNAMDIDQLDYAPIGSKERDRRRRLGLCYKCGSANHLSPDCRKPLPSGPMKREIRTVDEAPARTRPVYPLRTTRRDSDVSRTSDSSSPEPQPGKARSRN